MDLQLFSSLIKELILKNDKVYLPKLGSFITDTAPAYYSENKKIINPPYRRLFFRSKEMQDDGLLVNLYAKKTQLSVEEASNEIDNFIDTLIERLSIKKSVIIEDFGTLRITNDNIYFFVPKDNLDIFPEMKGLNPISINQLSQISKDGDKPSVNIPDEILENEKEEFSNVPIESKYQSHNRNEYNDRDDSEYERNPKIEHSYDSRDTRNSNEKTKTVEKTVLSQKTKKTIWITIGIIVLAIISLSFFKNNINNILYSPEELELIQNNQK